MGFKTHGAYIAAIVVPTLIVSLLLFCCCIGCCSERHEVKKDVEQDPARYKHPSTATRKPPARSTSRTLPPNNLSSVLPSPPAPQPETASTSAHLNRVSYRALSPPVTISSVNSHRTFEQTKDSLDLPRFENYWRTRRPPTPPQDVPRDRYSQYTNNAVHPPTNPQEFPEFRGLRSLSAPASILVPPPAIIADGDPQEDDLPTLTPYDGSGLGMHDEGPSRKPTPRFAVPITRPQTAASSPHFSGTAIGEIHDSIPLTEMSRSGTRSFMPKVQAKKRVDDTNGYAPKTPKSLSRGADGSTKLIVEEAPPPPRELIVNDEGLTPAQIARNLPRKGFVPKVAATVKHDDETS